MGGVTRSQPEAAPAKAATPAMPNPLAARGHQPVSARTPTAAGCPCGGGCPKCAAQVTGIPPIVNETVHSSGHALDEATRQFMEPRFGVDLSGVRVHTDAQAAASARAVQARAYTVGQDVVFAEGQFTPGTNGGRELLAHELAHTVQQRGGSGSPPIDAPHSDHERTARSAARDIAGGQHLQTALPSAAVGLSRSPDDERAKAVAEAEAVLKKIEEDDAEAAKQEAEDEAKAERRREEILRPSASLIKHHPKFIASQMTDEQIYADPNTERAKAVAEAEAVIAEMEKTQKEAAEHEQAEAEAEAAEDASPRVSSPYDDPLAGFPRMTDDEIYEDLREPTADEPAYWMRQDPKALSQPMNFGSETRYVRKWVTQTIPGVGDQGSKSESVDVSSWTIDAAGLRGLIGYATGERPTPFEESIASGARTFEEGFAPVSDGGELRYYTVSGGSGGRVHVIYNRDGTVNRQWVSETPLVNMGIGPIALLLPGIGLRSMARGGVALTRGGLATGRTALGWAERALKPFARKTALTTKLAIGRAEAGAGLAAPTALGGVTSAEVTIVGARSGLSSLPGGARTTTQATEVASVAQTAPTVAPTATTAAEGLATTAARTPTSSPFAFPWQAGNVYYSVGAGWRRATDGPSDWNGSGGTPTVASDSASTGSDTGAPTAATAATAAHGGAQAVEDTHGIPQEIADTGSGAVTAPIGNPQAQVARAGVQIIGDYKVVGTREVTGDAVSWHIPVLARQGKATHDVRGILNLFRWFIEDGRKAGVSSVRLTGELVANQNVMNIKRLAERFGGTSRVIDSTTIEIILPVPK